jgi:hypothetical protein
MGLRATWDDQSHRGRRPRDMGGMAVEQGCEAFVLIARRRYDLCISDSHTCY